MRRRPLVAFFTFAFAASLVALLVIGLPSLRSAPKSWDVKPLICFPFMVIIVGLTGVGLSAVIDGRPAARRLLRGARPRRLRVRYYAALLIPPAAILTALCLLWLLVSPAFKPNWFPIGILAGLLAGLSEELGWSGFAYPRMQTRFGTWRAAIVLGLLWALWHLPVVDSLGVAHPHGPAWPFFYLAFALVLISLRLLITWVYTQTGNLFLAQLMHASSTGFLVVFGASHVDAWQEAGWYGLYGALLGLAAVSVILATRFQSRPANAQGHVPGRPLGSATPQLEPVARVAALQPVHGVSIFGAGDRLRHVWRR
jgi:membrane protease YdiL (CAAX protease family)